MRPRARPCMRRVAACLLLTFFVICYERKILIRLFIPPPSPRMVFESTSAALHKRAAEWRLCEWCEWTTVGQSKVLFNY